MLMPKKNSPKRLRTSISSLGMSATRSTIILAAIASSASGPLAAQTPHMQPAQIDMAIEAFTGKSIGNIGGAKHPSDPRLRLAQCPSPLSVEWHGNRENMVRVACTNGPRWQIFVALKTAAPAAKLPDAIRRGDNVTITVEGDGFSIRRPGQAQQSGAIGDWITVQTTRKSEPVSARIVRPGLVIIPI